MKTLKTTIEVNKKQKILLSKKLEEEFESLKGLTIALLGLTFKPGTDDIREAPSIYNVKYLLKKQATIKAYDPIGIDNFKRVVDKDSSLKRYKNKIKYFNSIDETISNADAVLIMTEWDAIKDYPINKYIELMNKAYIFDGRNCYALSDIKDSAIFYFSIGRKKINNL